MNVRVQTTLLEVEKLYGGSCMEGAVWRELRCLKCLCMLYQQQEIDIVNNDVII